MTVTGVDTIAAHAGAARARRDARRRGARVRRGRRGCSRPRSRTPRCSGCSPTSWRCWTSTPRRRGPRTGSRSASSCCSPRGSCRSSASCAECGESEHLQRLLGRRGRRRVRLVRGGRVPARPGVPTASWSARSACRSRRRPRHPSARCAQAERAITETAEHHAHVRLRPLLAAWARGRWNASLAAWTHGSTLGRGVSCDSASDLRRFAHRSLARPVSESRRDERPDPTTRLPTIRPARWPPRSRERIRAREERELSPLATRSYPAPSAQRPEPDCGLRTPFQRDRDRIVHCKAFRRLKHKTQVFVAPDRRPLPHAADPHARGHADLAHGGARAAPQRGPGRGDRARPRPRPPAVRARRRGGARPLPARAVRLCVPAPRALAARRRHARARRRRAEPDRAGARRDRRPLRAGRGSRRRSRARSSG